MTISGTQLRPEILAARRELSEGRIDARAAHDRGASGRVVCARLTTLVDGVISKLYWKALEDLPDSAADRARSDIALVAVGGYGRRQLAPYSDVDLMILYQGRKNDALTQVAKRMTQDVFDVGLVLGHSVRTAAQAIQLAKTDFQIATSLTEARIIAGSQTVQEEFAKRLAVFAKRRRARLIAGAAEERRQERIRFGETNYLLEPNIKRSRGGLRDVQLLRWLAFFFYGINDPDQLLTEGRISKLDHRRMTNAQEFLLRLRNAMHFKAERAQDILDRPRQIQLADEFGYRGTDAMLPVERMMQDYFWHTTQVWYLARRFSNVVQSTTTGRRVVGSVFEQDIDGLYRVGRSEIRATPEGLGKMKENLAIVLGLVELASEYDRRIAPSTWSTIYLAAPQFRPGPSADDAREFMRFLSGATHLGRSLRRLHELGILERFIPGFTHARCLLQFNQYHKYTVDEHCIRAVESAIEFTTRDDALGVAYREIDDKSLLHLALLIHDLGKGRVEDHSIVGEAIAEETADRLGLSDERKKRLAILVRHHLLMSHTAFRRDTRDPAELAKLADLIGDAETLQILFVLTCADLKAVGPDVLTDWKVAVLEGLRRRTLAAIQRTDGAEATEIAKLRADVLQALAGRGVFDIWCDLQINGLPLNLLHRRSADDIAGALLRWKELPDGMAEVVGSYREAHRTVEFDAVVAGGKGKGSFAKMAGTLAARGFDILSATINTLPAGISLLRFVTEDIEATDRPIAARIAQVADALASCVHSDTPPAARRVWERETPSLKAQAIERSAFTHSIRFDAETNDRFTILEIRAFDRRGLLYDLALALHELELSIHIAKIATLADQIVDVFYLTDRDGNKVVGETAFSRIRDRLTPLVALEPTRD